VIQRLPGWMVDGLMAALFALVAVVVERQTEGRLATSTIALWIGVGSFLLLRLGAGFARAGRTLGCGFVFALTWLLPCVVALSFSLDANRRAIVRDSPLFFILSGIFVILIMVLTFERIRLADVARFAGLQAKLPSPEV
jgi:hypothetical protein